MTFAVLEADEDQIEQMHVDIDGDWLLGDLQDFASAIKILHGIFAILQNDAGYALEGSYRYSLPELASKLSNVPVHDISIERIKYSSPGCFDLIGFGKAFKEVRSLIIEIVDRIIESEDRTIRRERERVEIQALKIRNLAEIVHLIKEVNIGHSDKNSITNAVINEAEVIRKFVERGLITKVRD